MGSQKIFEWLWDRRWWLSLLSKKLKTECPARDASSFATGRQLIVKIKISIRMSASCSERFVFGSCIKHVQRQILWVCRLVCCPDRPVSIFRAVKIWSNVYISLILMSSSNDFRCIIVIAWNNTTTDYLSVWHNCTGEYQTVCKARHFGFSCQSLGPTFHLSCKVLASWIRQTRGIRT